MPIDVLALDHHGVQVADLDRALGWYAEQLGLAETVRYGTPGGFESVFLEGHGARLELFTTADDGPRPGTSRTHVAFRVDDVERAAAGLELLAGPMTNAEAGRRSVLLADPDGNVVELVERL
jgi:catechol 2,3-dioxygenase-like lactoylglutathione lyase family enzyme